MSETPDFEQLAREIDRIVTEYARTTLDLPDPMPAIVEQLRQVWNARGAADLDAMESAHSNYDWSELEDAIRSLDR